MGLQSKMLDWTEWMDTPQTVTTTRAPAVLKKHKAKAKAKAKDEYDVKNQGN